MLRVLKNYVTSHQAIAYLFLPGPRPKQARNPTNFTALITATLSCRRKRIHKCVTSAGMVRVGYQEPAPEPRSGTCSGTSAPPRPSPEPPSEPLRNLLQNLLRNLLRKLLRDLLRNLLRNLRAPQPSPEPAPNLLQGLYYGRTPLALLWWKN